MTADRRLHARLLGDPDLIAQFDGRAQLQAMRRTAGELGAVMAPPAAGVAATLFSAGASFWFFAPLHALSAILLIAVARESLQGRRRPGAPTTEEIEAGKLSSPQTPL